VYRSALRSTGSIVFGLPEDDGCDSLGDDIVVYLRRTRNVHHGLRGESMLLLRPLIAIRGS
jgi:hypothetical protein